MYSYEENNPPSVLFDDVHKSLLNEFPNISKKEIKFLYHGSYNVYEVKKNFIFKFPDKTINPELLYQEKSFLDFFIPNITYKIPEPLFYDFISQQKYLGYEKIPGVSLSRVYEKISDKKKQKLADQMASFLNELHSPKLLELFKKKFNLDFTLTKYKRQIEEQYEAIRKNIYPKLNIDQKKWIDELFTQYLDDNSNFQFIPCIVHSDFDTSNILVDSQTFSITGIIDFEEINVYDRAADLLFFGEGKIFTKYLIRNYLKYTKIKDESLNTRRRFLYRRIPLIYLEYGLEHNLNAMVKFGMDFLNYLLKIKC